MKAKSKLNKQWHEQHPMPQRPTMEQRIAWHLEHSKHCGCRDIPDTVKEEMDRRGILSGK